MRYLCFVKRDERLADPPQALMGAIGLRRTGQPEEAPTGS